MLEVGKRVLIQTFTQGCYHGHTGTIVSQLTSDPKQAKLPGFEFSAGALDAWFRVKLDYPADNGGKPVTNEVFMPRELVEI